MFKPFHSINKARLKYTRAGHECTYSVRCYARVAAQNELYILSVVFFMFPGSGKAVKEASIELHALHISTQIEEEELLLDSMG